MPQPRRPHRRLRVSVPSACTHFRSRMKRPVRTGRPSTTILRSHRLAGLFGRLGRQLLQKPRCRHRDAASSLIDVHPRPNFLSDLRRGRSTAAQSIDSKAQARWALPDRLGVKNGSNALRPATPGQSALMPTPGFGDFDANYNRRAKAPGCPAVRLSMRASQVAGDESFVPPSVMASRRVYGEVWEQRASN